MTTDMTTDVTKAVRPIVKSLHVSRELPEDMKSEVKGDRFTITHPDHDDPEWQDRRELYTLHADDPEFETRMWIHHVETSTDDPVRFRAAIEHYRGNKGKPKHEPQLYTLEIGDDGVFHQNDPNATEHMPPAVYQSFLALAVGLRDAKHRTVNAILDGHLRLEAAPEEDPQTAEEMLIEMLFPRKKPKEHEGWTQEEQMYDICIAEAGKREEWSMGLEQTQKEPMFLRAYAQNQQTGERHWMAVSDNKKFICSQGDLSAQLPEEVYAGLYGLALGAQVARKLSLDAARQGRSFMTVRDGVETDYRLGEQRADHDLTHTDFASRITADRVRHAAGREAGISF